MQKRPRSAESGYSSSDDHSDFSSVVQGIGRLNLEDDGVRNWHDQAITMLNNFYPDWKNLRSSYMVPSSFHLTNSKDQGQLTEKYIFDLLENFGQEYKEPMFVVHSYNFNELCDSIHSTGDSKVQWFNGEHDFVIIHKHYGVIFLQVKAKNKKKNWRQTFSDAQAQIQKDKVSLNTFLKKQFASTAKKRPKNFGLFTYPGFVVMPNCERPVECSLPTSNGLFKEDCSSLESFRSWWLEKVANPHIETDPDVFEKLLIRFVALQHYNPPLGETFDHQIAKFFTQEQLKIFMQSSSPQQWITGPAGSGKTVLLIDRVLALQKRINVAGREERILVLVFNKPLRDHLHQSLKGNKIEILTYMQFLYNKKIIPEGMFYERNYSYKEKCEVIESSYDKLKSKPPRVEEKYEHIFVDEGQDLFNEHWPELLKLFHNEPDSNPHKAFYFWVMFDSNQYVQPGRKQLPLSHFRNAARLTQVLRNTENVFSLSKKYFNSFDQENKEIELGHKVVGLDILWVNELQEDKSNLCSLVDEQIRKLRQKKVNSKDIAILTTTKTLSNDLTDRLEDFHQVQCQNAEGELQSNQVIVDSIRRFKGLESKVVILVDPKYTVDRNFGNQASELMYVGVSRCLCYLIIISTESGCEYLQSDAGLRNLNLPRDQWHKDKFLSLQLDARFCYDNN